MGKFEEAILKQKVAEAIERIKNGYSMTDGKIYLAFSGGKDSTVVAELIKMANLDTYIPFVFTDTCVEYKAIEDFVYNYDYPNMKIVKPQKNFEYVIEKFGIPAISKVRSEALSCHDRYIGTDKFWEMATIKILIRGEMMKNGKGMNEKSTFALAEKHFHFLHPDRVAEYKIHNKCCDYLKIHPLYEFKVFNQPKGYFNGVRVAEGGIRKFKTKDYYKIRKKEKDIVFSPIFDWDDELEQAFINYYNVEISRAYTEYGMTRTGCIGCPFAKDCASQLEKAYKFEPYKYKEAIQRFKLVYIDQGVELPFDEEYMEEFRIRDEINKIRRQEMLDKYDDVRYKPWKFWE